MPELPNPEDNIEAALRLLSQASAAINAMESGSMEEMRRVLQIVVDGAASVAPGGCAALYPYDGQSGTFDLTGRVLYCRDGEPTVLEGLDACVRPGGAGERAVSLRQVVLQEEGGVHPNGGALEMPAGAAACLPMIASEEALGVLCVAAHVGQTIVPTQATLLECFADLGAMALVRSRQLGQVQQEQARKERELRRLRRAGMLISSRSNLKETLDAILQVALEITDAVYGIFRLVDRDGTNLVCEAISGIDLGAPAVETLPIDFGSVMGTVALRREPVMIPDLREEPWQHVYYPFDREIEMRSELAVPLIGASGRLEGVLNLESTRVNGFDRQDRYILQILASQAVVAIQEARLLDALQEISSLLPRLSTRMIHQKLAEQACDLLNTPVGMIWLRDRDGLVLQAVDARVASSGFSSVTVGCRLDLDRTLAGLAIREARPVTLPPYRDGDPPGGPRPDFLDLPGKENIGPALAVPLVSSPDGSPIGALAVFAGPEDPRDFETSDWDKKVLDILGHYATLAGQLATQQEALRSAQEQRATAEAFAAVGDIAANLLHRLNNKIGTIPVRVEGIQDKSQHALQTDAYLEKNLFEIQNSAMEAMAIVRESLFHLHPIELAPVSVAESAREALHAVHLPEGVMVFLEGLDLLPPVQAGPHRLALVFGNLIENAADAMNGRGNIHIQGSAGHGRVLIRVSDDGPGIDPRLHDTIFEFNTSLRSQAHPGRLGFGLWWVKTLMARFGGGVAVESDGHSGSTFLLDLPQARDVVGGVNDA